MYRENKHCGAGSFLGTVRQRFWTIKAFMWRRILCITMFSMHQQNQKYCNKLWKHHQCQKLFICMVQSPVMQEIQLSILYGYNILSCSNIQAIYHKGPPMGRCKIHLFNNEFDSSCSIEFIRSNNLWCQLYNKNPWLLLTNQQLKLSTV